MKLREWMAISPDDPPLVVSLGSLIGVLDDHQVIHVLSVEDLDFHDLPITPAMKQACVEEDHRRRAQLEARKLDLAVREAMKFDRLRKKKEEEEPTTT